MAMNGISMEYRERYRYQEAVSVSEPERLDTEGNQLLTNSRYWVVSDGDEELYVYNDLVNVDNFLENFKDSGYDDFDDAKKALRKYCPEAALVVYCGHNRFKGVSAWMQ